MLESGWLCFGSLVPCISSKKSERQIRRFVQGQNSYPVRLGPTIPRGSYALRNTQKQTKHRIRNNPLPGRRDQTPMDLPLDPMLLTHTLVRFLQLQEEQGSCHPHIAADKAVLFREVTIPARNSSRKELRVLASLVLVRSS